MVISSRFALSCLALTGIFGCLAPAQAVPLEQLFPFAVSDEQAAASGCGGLMDVNQIAQAASGALVFLDMGGKSAVIPNSTVPQLLAAIRDPSDDKWPVNTKVAMRAGRYVETIARREATDRDHGSVKCWWAWYGKNLRLTAIEITAGP